MKLKFNEHLQEKINKCNRIIGSMKKLSLILPRTCHLTIYKGFVMYHLDYADIIYDKPDNESFNRGGFRDFEKARAHFFE